MPDIPATASTPPSRGLKDARLFPAQQRVRLPSRDSFASQSGSIGSSCGSSGDNNRAMFDKLMKDKTATFRNHYDALRFVKTLIIISPLAAVWRLQRPDQLGAQRLHEILTLPSRFQISDADVVNQIYTPILNLIGSPELRCDETAVSAIQQLSDLVWTTAFVKERIRNAALDNKLQDSNAIINFLITFVITNREKAASEYESMFLVEFAQELLLQGHHVAERLLKILNRIGEGSPSLSLSSIDHQPGGRHDNDYADIARINIIPTLNEASLFTADRNRMAYLPRADVLCDHLRDDPCSALRDRAFRLLREEMMSSLRDQLVDNKQRKFTFVCKSASAPEVQRRPCVEIAIKVPDHIRSMSNDEEMQFWAKSKLGPGALCCLLKNGKPAMFGEVLKQKFRQRIPDKEKASFTDSICLSFFNKDNLQALFQLHSNNGKDAFELALVCSSFFSYKPVLEALQSSQDSQLLAYIASSSFLSSPVDFPRSRFIQSNAALINNPEFPEFVFIRNPIRNPTGLESFCKISDSIVEKYLQLDETQNRALKDAVDFQRKFSLVQGPPGTGKTLIGVLVALALAAIKDVKILCVCQTNHQLDQFLEAILDAGLTDIVRIGGRSQSAALEPFQLERLKEKSEQVSGPFKGMPQHNSRLWDLKKTIEQLQNELKPLQEMMTQKNLDREIFNRYIDGCPEFDYESDDGFTRNGLNGKPIRSAVDLFAHWRAGGTSGARPTDGSMWSFSRKQRFDMIAQWELEIRNECLALIANKYQRITMLQEEQQLIRDLRYISILTDAKVIGCTTTGAAKFRSLISNSGRNVLIVEEAAEILEAHIISILSDRIEKVVMIGDHKQLRPNIKDYTLSVESGNGYDLNRSTFERLIHSRHPFICLETQHRMRPEISAIVRGLCYEKLRDGDLVGTYPRVNGLQKDVIFVNHNSLEDQDKVLGTASNKLIKSGSKFNKVEAELIVATAAYLCQQGYDSKDLVILTPYLGQMIQIKRELSKRNIKAVLGEADSEELDRALAGDRLSDASADKEGHQKKMRKPIRVSTVDNFQGEQSFIVLVSLVRSNMNDDIGFLNSVERINVMISRAQAGLIVFGNQQCLTGKSRVWRRVISHFNCFNGVPVICSRHGTTALVSKSQDFKRLTPNGGCQKTCDFVLACGHQCSIQCHDSKIMSHGKCKRKVPDLCPNEHEIWRICSEQSPLPCKAELIDICSKNKHKFVRACGLRPETTRCPICKKQEEFDRRKLQLQFETEKKLVKVAEQQAKRLIEIDEENTKRAADAKVEEKRSLAEADLQQAQARKYRAEQEAKRRIQQINAQCAKALSKCDEELEEIIKQAANQVSDKAEQLKETQQLRDHLRTLCADMQCNICFEDYKLADGLTCSNNVIETPHFFCKDCFDKYVAMESQSDLRVLLARDAKILCPETNSSGCNSPAFGDYEIFRTISKATFAQFCKAKDQVLLTKNNEANEQVYQKRLEAELRVREQGALRHKIISKLTPACPRCKAAFIDFVGCCALSCHKCPCKFCAYCLEDCGTDAHAHVANCPYNHVRDVFASEKQWKDCRSIWVRDQIVQLLRGQSVDAARASLEQCRRELDDVGVNFTDIVHILSRPA